MTPESLPNRFDHAEAQPRIYAAWEQRKFFHAEPDEREPDKRFTIVIPPPNVTGALHLGHALNNTLQDIQIRMHRMLGHNTLWMPGTDHAGIATQAVVERRLKEEENLTRHDLGPQKLVDRIWAWKEQYEARILGQLKQMGASCDWDRTRFTLDAQCATAVRQTFFDLFQKGLIYRGKRLVNWDTFLQTAVSDDEVFQETVRGKFYHFKYPVVPLVNSDPRAGEPTHVEIATTRPETMLGDTAVAVHPEPAAALDRAEAELRERLVKAPAKEHPGIQQQIDNIAERRASMLPLLETLAAMAKAGRKLMLPLAGREIPLIADIWAKPELGTGAVKITPAHDTNDYEVWKRNEHIGLINILNPDGTLNASAGAYQGLKMLKAREKVVADLDDLGLLGDIEDREIELPHSDRSKTPIEPYLADQWFVRMGDVDGQPGLAQSAMDAVSNSDVKIFPERYAKSYLDWLGEKRDWPVSRQLWWGHRIPIWSRVPKDGDNANQRLVALRNELEDWEDRFAVCWARSGGGNAEQVCLGAFGDFEASWEVTEKTIIDDLEAAGFVQDPDVLDTWFSSALWPHSTLGWPEQTKEMEYYYPTSTLITSRDIITLWVARMVLMGLNNVGQIPFREVFIHPKILDGYGETMSKSKGNGVDPLDIVDKFGADALRFGLTMLCTETQDVRMPVQFECPHCQTLIDQTKKNRELPRVKCEKCGGEFSTQWARTDADKALPRGAVVSERFEVARNFTSKLWNASRFALINLQGYAAFTDDTPRLKALAANLGVRFVDVRNVEIPSEVIELMPERIARELNILPLAEDSHQLTFLIGKPADTETMEKLQFILNRRVDYVLAPADQILAKIDEHYGVDPSRSRKDIGGSTDHDLNIEDRWILSRLASVTREVTAAITAYRYADAAKSLYDFAWDEFCSFYIEMAKPRLQDESTRPHAQRVLAHVLDGLLRLLHPMMPFVTEEVWQLLGQLAPQRGLPEPAKANDFIITAPWPIADQARIDGQIESRFRTFQQALAALREIRARQNISMKQPIEFAIRCDEATAALLTPMQPYFTAMANAAAITIGTSASAPKTHAKTALSEMEIYVDLKDFIDVKAEIAKNEKLEQQLLGVIKGKEAKLSNESFVARAPANVVATERDALAKAHEQLLGVRETLAALRAGS